ELHQGNGTSALEAFRSRRLIFSIGSAVIAIVNVRARGRGRCGRGTFVTGRCGNHRPWPGLRPQEGAMPAVHESDSSPNPKSPTCPRCGAPMRLVSTQPATKYVNVHQARYVCDCGAASDKLIADDS